MCVSGGVWDRRSSTVGTSYFGTNGSGGLWVELPRFFKPSPSLWPARLPSAWNDKVFSNVWF